MAGAGNMPDPRPRRNSYHYVPSPGTAIPVNTKHLYNICTMTVQRRRRWAGVVQMLYKCFVFTRIPTLPRFAIRAHHPGAVSRSRRAYTLICLVKKSPPNALLLTIAFRFHTQVCLTLSSDCDGPELRTQSAMTRVKHIRHLLSLYLTHSIHNTCCHCLHYNASHLWFIL